MLRLFIAALVALVALGGASAQAPAPQLLAVSPTGAKAGDAVEVTLSGHGFDGGEKLLFSAKGFTAEAVGAATTIKAQPGQPTSSVKFKVTAPKDTSGTFDVRVVGKNGLSNPRAFVVSTLADVSEAEPNNDVGQAQKVELNTTVNGVVSAPTDVDFVSFKAPAGQNVVVYCLTSSIDSRMQADVMVGGPDGKVLASNRGYRGGDAVLDFKVPADGEYLVRVSQFAYTTGGHDHFYRLTVTTRPWVDAVFPPLGPVDSIWHKMYGRNLIGELSSPSKSFIRPDGRPFDEMEIGPISPRLPKKSADELQPGFFTPVAGGIDAVPFNPLWAAEGAPLLSRAGLLILDNEKNGTAADAQEVKPPCDVAGRIAKKGERHWYSFDAKKGAVWTLEVFAERIGSPVDAYFVVADAAGKVIAELDDGPDTLSPNQFYTKGDDPARYRFVAPADGAYKVMVSTREAGVQFGVRDQYVLRIAPETPDFRLAVMPLSPHIPDAATLPKGGAACFAVFVFRFDGFNDAIELSATDLPKGVNCPKHVVGPGQTRGVLVLTCDKEAAEWDGFVTVTGSAGKLKHAARPFTVTWPAVGLQAGQMPTGPLITRMDRGGGLALAVRGEAPFTLTPTETALTAKPGGKVEVTLKVSRKDAFKDPITLLSASPGFGPRPQGNQPFPPVGTIQPNGTELKVSIDVPANLPPGEHSLVLRGVSGAAVPKGGNAAPLRAQPTFAVAPISVVVGK